MKYKTVQIISYRLLDNFKAEWLVNSEIANPSSLDEFDVTIIDLTDEELWRNRSNGCQTVNSISDLRNLVMMIGNSKNTKIIFLLPNNITFKNSWVPSKSRYVHTIYFKNILRDFETYFLKNIFKIPIKNIVFENTKTIINGVNYIANFFFSQEDEILTASQGSSKATTVSIEEKILTFLNINNLEKLKSFLLQLNLIDNREAHPEWFSTIKMFDDVELNKKITTNEKIINNSKVEINNSKSGLEKNNRFKSVLYTNSDELVKVVFEILEEILVCDLSEFIDQKKEDFIIKKTKVTFLGEIKGVSSNVKSEHISQLDVHLQMYQDKLEEENLTEKVKSLLIINHQRNKDLVSRSTIHNNQIRLAKRNNSLIIETFVLLKFYEKFINGQVKSDFVIELFSKKCGKLNESDF